MTDQTVETRIKGDAANASAQGKTASRAERAIRKLRKPRPTKQAQLIRLLKAKGGKDVATISDALGWQPHTTRAALSRLRSAGFEITREVPKSGGPARYRIAAEPEA